MPSTACVDIGIALKLLLPEEDSAAAHGLWRSWIDAGVPIVAPPIFVFEGTSVLCTQVHRGRITPDEARAMLAVLGGLGVRLLGPDDLHVRALDLALRHGHPQAYDAHYLAVAERLDAELWTGDARLARAVEKALPWVRLLT